MSTHGRTTWVELFTTDPAAAQAFYSEVIGWKPMPWGPPEANYTVFMVGEAAAAGVVQLPQEAAKTGAPPMWMRHVGTDDVAASVAKLQELGGKLLMGPSDTDVGTIAFVSDPHGAAFGIFAPKAERAPKSGAGFLVWEELMAGNLEEAKTFYTTLFGWQEAQTMDMGPMGTYWMWKVDDDGPMVGGVMARPQDAPVPPNWLMYFHVDDLDAALARVKNSGGQVLNGPMEVPGGEFVAQCLDPQGAAFALHGDAPS